jgi:hypothetical protein
MNGVWSSSLVLGSFAIRTSSPRHRDKSTFGSKRDGWIANTLN